MARCASRTGRLGLRSYAELRARTDGPAGSSWSVFGANDELGTLNFITQGAVRKAAAVVRRGAVFNLDCPLEEFDPPVAAHRRSHRHTLVSYRANRLDDYVDSLYLQVSSQIDGLRHQRHHLHGFYNGVPDEDIGPGLPRLGVNRWAERGGIVGRGVLLDVERHLARHGVRIDQRTGPPIDVDLLAAVASEQQVQLSPGDSLLIRTGWLGFYRGLTAEEKAAIRADLRCTGIVQSHEMLAWIWDHRLAMVAADNVGLEVVPAVSTSPFRTPDGYAPELMHPEMIALLGLIVGELWSLDELAADCAADGSYEFLLVAKPLHLAGGVGSPANAVAIK